MPKIIIVSFDFFFTKEITKGIAIKSSGQTEESYIKNNITNVDAIKRILLRAKALGTKVVITLPEFDSMSNFLEGKALVEQYLKIILLGTTLDDLEFLEIYLYPSTDDFSLQHIQAIIDNYNKAHTDSPINEKNKKDWVAIFHPDLTLVETLQKEYSIIHIDNTEGHFLALEQLLQIGKNSTKNINVDQFNKTSVEGKKKQKKLLNEQRLIRQAINNIKNIIYKLTLINEIAELYGEAIKNITRKYSIFSLELLANEQEKYLIALKQVSDMCLMNYELDINQVKLVIDENGHIVKVDEAIKKQTIQQLSMVVSEIIEKYQSWPEYVIQQDSSVSISDQISELLQQEEQRAVSLCESYQKQRKEYMNELEKLKEKHKDFLKRYNYFIWQFEAKKNQLTNKAADKRSYIEKDPVFNTCLSGNKVKLQELLEKEKNLAKLKQMNDFGKTPFHLACENGHYEIVKLLLDCHINELDLDLQASLGPCAIHLAAERKHNKIVKLLLQHGASTNVLGYRTSRTPLYYAIQNQNYDLIDLLFEYGAEIDIYTTNDVLCSDLHHAVNKPSIEVLEQIMRWYEKKPNQINVDFINSKGFSAMGETILLGHYDVAELFLKYGIRLSIIEYKKIKKHALKNPKQYDHIINILKDYDARFDNLAGELKNLNNPPENLISNDQVLINHDTNSSVVDFSQANNTNVINIEDEENSSSQDQLLNSVEQTEDQLHTENSNQISTNAYQFFAPAKANIEHIYQTVPNIPKSLSYQPLTGNGHRLYQAVALYTNNGDQHILRQVVNAHLEANLDKFYEFITLPDGQTMEGYLQAVREGIEWDHAIEIEVLMRALNRPILVISDQGLTNSDDVKRFTGVPIFVYCNVDKHYDGLLLKEAYTSEKVIEDLIQLNNHSSNVPLNNNNLATAEDYDSDDLSDLSSNDSKSSSEEEIDLETMEQVNLEPDSYNFRF